jgi:ankyrin repeat protein
LFSHSLCLSFSANAHKVFFFFFFFELRTFFAILDKIENTIGLDRFNRASERDANEPRVNFWARISFSCEKVSQFSFAFEKKNYFRKKMSASSSLTSSSRRRRTKKKSSSRHRSKLAESDYARYKESLYEQFCLIFGAAQGDLGAVKKSVEEGADVNEGDYDRRTALHLAAAEGHVAVASYLIDECRASVNAEDRWGGTPLQDAMAHKHDELAQLLRNNGARILNAAVLADKLTQAASDGDLPLLKRLVENGAVVNEKDYDGRTALHLAASEGRIFCVEYLLDVGASVDATDRWGGTPLLDAIKSKHDSVAQLLQRKGASLVKSEEIGASLCHAASKGDLPLLKRIVEAGGRPAEAMDYDSRTPLHLAASGGYTAVCEYLIDKGCDINAKDCWHGTPLADATRHGHAELAELLKAKGGAVADAKQIEQMSKYALKAGTALHSSVPAPDLDAAQLAELDDAALCSQLADGLAFSSFVELAIGELSTRAADATAGADERKASLVRADAIDIVCGALQMHADGGRVELARAGARFLEEIGSADQYLPAIANAGGVRELLDLAALANDAGVRHDALSALSAISFLSPGAEPSLAEPVAQSFAHENGVRGVLAAARRSSDDPIALKRAIQTLWHVCIFDPSNLSRVEHENGLDAIVHFWRERASDPNIAHAAVGASQLMVRRASLEYVFREHLGGVEQLLAAIDTHSDDDEVVSMALATLSFLTEREAAAFRGGSSSGGSSLSSSSSSSGVSVGGSSSGGSSPSGDRGRALLDIFIEKKGANIVIETMRLYHKDRLIQEHAATILINTAKAGARRPSKQKVNVVGKEGARAIAAAAKRFSSSDQLVLIDRELKQDMKECTIM